MTTNLIPFGTRTASMFEDFRREVDDLMSRMFDRDQFGDEAWFNPRLDVAETDEAFEVTVDLPGLKAEDFTVELRNGDLWVTGERKEEHEETEKDWHRVERRRGKFRRMVRLGEGVNPETVDAEYKDGVLKVRVPKTEVAKPKRVEIKG